MSPTGAITPLNYDSIPQNGFRMSPYVVPIGFHTDPLHGSEALHDCGYLR